MALSILNNIPSLVAQNQLQVTNNNLQNTLFQLSSGSRINTGADDAAGLAIANGLQANISALQQSAQNASAGVGSLQVADGALSQVTTLLNRAVTLATEASNGGLSTSQLTALNNQPNRYQYHLQWDGCVHGGRPEHLPERWVLNGRRESHRQRQHADSVRH